MMKVVKSGRMELPPRARRILIHAATRAVTAGTTSACAENTGVSGKCSLRSWNYLRVRGEYSPKLSVA